MIRDEEKYQKARDFRKRGFSYSEIARIAGVSKATVSNWFSKQAFSKKVRQDNERKARRENVKRIGLVNKARAAERQRRYREAIRAADTEFRHYKHLPRFMGGLMLYAGAGDLEDPRILRLSDSRPEAHCIMIRFAVDFLGADRGAIRCWLALPAGVSDARETAAWSKALRLPPPQFHKSQRLSSDRPGTLRKTVGNTIIGSAILKRKLRRWIELASKELAR